MYALTVERHWHCRYGKRLINNLLLRSPIKSFFNCEMCVLHVVFQMEICLDSFDYLDVENDILCDDIWRRNQQRVAKG